MKRGARLDYHLHTTHSMDGEQSIVELCGKAVSLGLDEICITDHIDPHHSSPGVDKPLYYERWLEEIDNARNMFPQLQIRVGIEIGDNESYRDEIWVFLDKLPLDFRLLSLHLVNNVDPYDSIYFEGKSQDEAYEEYALARYESITNFKEYDSAAHLGYVGKFAPYPPEIRGFSHRHAPDIIDGILKYLIMNGKALEINASTIRNTGSPIPGADIIKRYVQLGGELFTFGSDAHTCSNIYANVDRAKEIAVSCGAKWQVAFNKRQPDVGLIY